MSTLQKILFFSIIIALSLSGCFKGQGDVKIKASVNYLGFEKTMPDLEIYIDNKKMGVTQGGFVTYKVDEGSHTVMLKESNKEFYYHFYSKTISIAPDSTIELIFDLRKKPKIEMSESRKENVAKLFKKYNLVGVWEAEPFYNEEKAKIILFVIKIFDNGLYAMGSNDTSVRGYSFDTITTGDRVIDTGKNIELTSKNKKYTKFIEYSDLNHKCLKTHSLDYISIKSKYCLSNETTLDKTFKKIQEFNSLSISERKNLHSLDDYEKNKLIKKEFEKIKPSPTREEEKKYILNIIKNGSQGIYKNKDDTIKADIMPPRMAIGKDAEVIATYVAGGLKGEEPAAFSICTVCHGGRGYIPLMQIGPNITTFPYIKGFIDYSLKQQADKK